MFNLYDLQKIFSKYDYQLSDITQDLYDKYIKNKFNQQVDIHLEHNENINKELHTSFNEQKTQNQFLRNINNNLLKTTHELIQNNNLDNLDKKFDTAFTKKKIKRKVKTNLVDIYRNRIFGDILKYNNISDNFTSEDLFDYLKLEITNLHNYQNTHSKNINLIRNCINDIYFFFKNDSLPLKTNSQLEKIEESYVSNYKRELLNISLDHDKLISNLKQIKNLYPTFPLFNINSLENIDNELQINIDYTLYWLKNTQDQGNSIFTICNILKLFDVLLIYMGDSRINRVSQEDINTLQDKLDILKRTYKEHQEKYKFYIDYCNGYTVSKLYRTRESLLEDNNKPDLRFDREFDNSVNNMNILNKIMATYGENRVTDENRNKLYSKLSEEIKMYYPYESSTNVNIMANVLLDNYGRLVKKNRGFRKVKGVIMLY